MDYKRLDGSEVIYHILQVLRESRKPLTTREVQKEIENRQMQCPDSTVVFLNRLRRMGVIEGQRSREMRGWIWWVKP